MNISSNSLFHFTDRIEVLVDILNDKFRGSYCREVLHYKEEAIPIYIPKISFCDIPLKTLSNYSIYGKFGIGLRKEWGIKNRLNPVLYLEKNSLLAESLINAIKGSLSTVAVTSNLLEQTEKKIADLQQREDLTKEEKQKHHDIYRTEAANFRQITNSLSYNIYSLYFTKHYEDDLVREGNTIANYRFYNEREWCYVPDFDCAVCELKLVEEDYKAWRGTTAQKPLLDKVNLEYSYEDIEHIIVEKESEVRSMIAIIRGIDSQKITVEQKELLFSKITSFERLISDY